MARIRTIKPEFFTSSDIVELSPLARLFYIGLWCEADKEGRMSWKPKTFKMRYFPGDDCSIEALCEELTSAGLVVLYGDGLAHIPFFAKHQHVNPRESASTLPAPEGFKNQGPRKVGKTLREAVLERDGFKCVRCGSDDHLQADHILPQSLGGPHIIENLRTLCRKCNAGRPVSGDALIKDLAADGHTIESLRVKFGIDASISGVHAQVGRKGRKGKEGKEGTPPSPQRGDEDVFEDFWLAWPKNERKQDKAKCLDHWKRHELTATAEAILADVRVKRGTQKWQDGFIEAPLVYLRGKRWEDGVTPESDGGNELGAQAWHETRKGIEAKGVELEIGLWDQNAFEIGRGEPWPTYQARVFRAAGHQPLRAIA